MVTTDKKFKIYVDLFKTDIVIIVSDDVSNTLKTTRILKDMNIKLKPKQRNIDISFLDKKSGYRRYYLILNRENQKLSDIIGCITGIVHKILHDKKINIRKNNSEIYSYIVEKILNKVIKKSELENKIEFE